MIKNTKMKNFVNKFKIIIILLVIHFSNLHAADFKLDSITKSSAAGDNGMYIGSASAVYFKTLQPSVIKGDLVNNGIFNSSHGLIEFAGAGNSEISGNSVSISGVRINKGTDTLRVKTDLTVEPDLNPSNPELNLSTGVLKIVGARTLTINSTITGSGKIAGNSNATINIGGSGSFPNLSLLQDNNSNYSLSSLIINRNGTASIDLADSLRIYGTFSINNNSATFNSAGKLTLISNANGTARVNELLVPSNFTGNVVSQRYIPQIATGPGMPRRYRMLSSSVNTGIGINLTQLQDDIYVSGPNWASNGFDQTPINNYSTYLYNESIDGLSAIGYAGIPTTAYNLPPAQGFYVMIRGERSQGPSTYTPPFVDPNPVTIDYIGEINKGNVTHNLSYTVTSGGENNDGFNLIGNPYPSAIDWESSSITKTNIDNSFYIYNPRSGSYEVFLRGVGQTGEASKYLSSGQGFFVVANAANPIITFREGCKTAINPSAFFRNNLSPDNHFRIRITKDNINSDETVLVFATGESNDFTSGQDALKFFGTGVNIAAKSTDGIYTSINFHSEIVQNDTIPLFVSAATIGTFQLNFISMLTFNPNYDVFLIDNYLKTFTNLRQQTNYSFDKTSDPLSFGDNRFKLVFGPSVPLSVNLLNFKAKKLGGKGFLQWQISSNSTAQIFEVEKSDDAKMFVKIGEINYKKNSANEYNFINDSPKNGFNYYRLKIKSNKYKIEYSSIEVLDFSQNKGNDLYAFPNPVNKSLELNLNYLGNETMSFVISDILGREVLRGIMNNDDNIYKQTTDVSKLAKGIYSVKAYSANAEFNVKFLKN